MQPFMTPDLDGHLKVMLVCCSYNAAHLKENHTERG